MIVSDTTPIRNSLHLGRIAVLGELFGTLHLPPAVKQEIDEDFTRYDKHIVAEIAAKAAI